MVKPPYWSEYSISFPSEARDAIPIYYVLRLFVVIPNDQPLKLLLSSMNSAW